MALPNIPFLDIVGAFAIAVFGGIISRYIHPEVVELINLIREKTEETPRWQKMLAVGIGIGVLIAYLPQTLTYLLSQLERFGIQPSRAVSTEIMLGFAVSAILIFQYRQTSLMQASLLSIEARLDSLEQTLESVESNESGDQGERAETDGGFDDTQDDEKNKQGTSGSGMVGGAIAGGIMGSSGGPPGAVLGAIIGGVLGDALEQASIENQKKKQIKAKIIQKMLRRHVVYPSQQNIHTVIQWFVADEQEMVRDVIEEMATDPETPIQYAGPNQNAIQLTDYEEAEWYLSEIVN